MLLLMSSLCVKQYYLFFLLSNVSLKPDPKKEMIPFLPTRGLPVTVASFLVNTLNHAISKIESI